MAVQYYDVEDILDDVLIEEPDLTIVRKWLVKWKTSDGTFDHSWEPYEYIYHLNIFETYQKAKKMGTLSPNKSSVVTIKQFTKKQYDEMMIKKQENKYEDGSYGYYQDEYKYDDNDNDDDDDDDDDDENDEDFNIEEEIKKKEKKVHRIKIKKKRNKKRKRDWSEGEEKRFIEGLKLYGRDWKLVSNHVNNQRNPQSIRSHSQIYFLKLLKNKENLPDKVRESGTGYTLSGKPLNKYSSTVLKVFQDASKVPDIEGVISDKESAEKAKRKKTKYTHKQRSKPKQPPKPPPPRKKRRRNK